jgi:hypothetical protein
MRATHIQRIGFGGITLLFGMILFAGQGMAMDPKKSKVVEHWNQERMNQAIPRDLVIDPRGLGYLKRPDGSFQPHGHQIAAENPPAMRILPRRSSPTWIPRRIIPLALPIRLPPRLSTMNPV